VRVQIHGLVRQLRQGRALNPERTRSAQQPDPSLEYRCPPCRQFIAPPPSFLFLFISIPHSSRFLPPDRLRPPFSEQADHALTCFFLETHCLPHSYQPTSTSCLASPRPRFDSSQSYFSACSRVRRVHIRFDLLPSASYTLLRLPVTAHLHYITRARRRAPHATIQFWPPPRYLFWLSCLFVICHDV
jgi:hypothetical protein